MSNPGGHTSLITVLSVGLSQVSVRSARSHSWSSKCSATVVALLQMDRVFSKINCIVVLSDLVFILMRLSRHASRLGAVTRLILSFIVA